MPSVIAEFDFDRSKKNGLQTQQKRPTKSKDEPTMSVSKFDKKAKQDHRKKRTNLIRRKLTKHLGSMRTPSSKAIRKEIMAVWGTN